MEVSLYNVKKKKTLLFINNLLVAAFCKAAIMSLV